MSDEDEILQKRLRELSSRAFSRGSWTFSDFLDLNGQSVLARAKVSSPFRLDGGFPGAERAVACFGSEELCGYDERAPITCVCMRPLSAKFADRLTHRDFLGSLMALGIKREVLGDILIRDNVGYLICLESISQYIADSLTSVKHTSVSCTVTDEIPQDALPKPETAEINVPSLRIDAAVAAVYRLSRGDSQELFRERRVFVNSAVCENTSYTLNEGDVISVRGRGRFVFTGETKETRKARLRIRVDIY
ncbi:MAG: hypothetical protein HUJ65_06655 [Oscillospiraceae bacterium]|nr:hypothetical protein [Oscillospiraceae bacterium]